MNVTEVAASNQPAFTAGSSQQVLQKVLDASRECVLVVGDDMRITASNAAAYDAFTRHNGSLKSKRLSEIARDAALHQAFQSAIENGNTVDIRLEIGSGERRKYDVHIAPIRLDGRQCAIGFFYDITQIEHLESVRQEFLSNISHELRTPLTSIMAFVETLEDGAIDDEENNRRFLGVIRRNAERMHSLIADILELSLIESGKVSIEMRDVRLAAAIDEVFSSLSAKAASRYVQLINDIRADQIVHVDSVRLEQMLTNLIDNAIKFNREGGSVTVACEQRGSRIIISVSDTGEGILPEHLQRIFERFYRADRARSRDIGGTGLGLAIVKHLAKLHGGEVFVTSELSRGTTFFIELPQQPELVAKART